MSRQLRAQAEALAALFTSLELGGVYIDEPHVTLSGPSEDGFDRDTLIVQTGWSDGNPWVVLEPGQRVGPGNVIKEEDE